MAQQPHHSSDELIFTGLGDRHRDRQVQRDHAKGDLVRIYSGIYTANKSDPLDAVINRNAFRIAGHIFPGSIVSGRSAIEMMPSRARDGEGKKTGPGVLFLTRTGTRRYLTFPGLDLRMAQGPGAQPGDYKFQNGIDLLRASLPRMLLENLAPSRVRDGISRAIGREGVENKLDRICTQEGESHLNQIRDEARSLAPALDMMSEFQVLDEIIGTLLGTRKAKLVSVSAAARSDGFAYDTECLARLKVLSRYLMDVGLPERRDTSVGQGHRAAASFIEAYFSNYIEGTRFPVQEAVTIVT